MIETVHTYPIHMKRYIDGFVLPVPKKNIEAYKKMSRDAGKIWIEYGALQYVEAVGEDMKKQPYATSFKEMVEPKRGETILFSFIMYKSRKHRDRVNEKVMKDPRMNQDGQDMDNMPFDCKRMAYNGFETIVYLP